MKNGYLITLILLAGGFAAPNLVAAPPAKTPSLATKLALSKLKVKADEEPLEAADLAESEELTPTELPNELTGEYLEENKEDLVAAETLTPNAPELSHKGYGSWFLRKILRHGLMQEVSLTYALQNLSTHPSLKTAAPPLVLVEALKDTLAADAWKHSWQLELKDLQRLKTDLAGISFDIPLAEHPLVDAYIDYFTGRGRWFFINSLTRSGRYLPMIKNILQAKGLPQDLVYLALIESGFSATARSVAAAVGIWQFMRPTGRSYGLKQDGWVDERRDFIKATEAAAAYLKTLHGLFGDWHLAWAAYNAGEGRIKRALDKYGEQSFWGLIEHHRSLTEQTRHYVPKIIAAAIVAKNLKYYGFDNITPSLPLDYEEITVSRAIDLRLLAQKMGIQVEILRELNPAYIYDITPPRQASLVRIPRGRSSEVLALITTLPTETRLVYLEHRVVKRETLQSIASLHHTPLKALLKANHLKSAKTRLRVGRILKVPALLNDRLAPPEIQVAKSDLKKKTKLTVTKKLVVAAAAKIKEAKPTKPSKLPQLAQNLATKQQKSGKNQVRHIVNHGETLWSIAQRYGVSVAQIKQSNGKRRNNLQVGDVLRIF